MKNINQLLVIISLASIYLSSNPISAKDNAKLPNPFPDIDSPIESYLKCSGSLTQQDKSRQITIEIVYYSESSENFWALIKDQEKKISFGDNVENLDDRRGNSLYGAINLLEGDMFHLKIKPVKSDDDSDANKYQGSLKYVEKSTLRELEVKCIESFA